MAENWGSMSTEDFLFGYLYRNKDYPVDKYIVRFYKTKSRRDTAASKSKEHGGVRKFQFKLKKLFGESILESDYNESP